MGDALHNISDLKAYWPWTHVAAAAVRIACAVPARKTGSVTVAKPLDS